MEKFAVDLDKVLDEFELNEDRAHELIAGQEAQPSGYQEFLLTVGENAYSCNDCMVPLPDSVSESAKPVADAAPTTASLRYDFPFEPTEKMNLSEADFSAAPRNSSSSQAIEMLTNVLTSVDANGEQRKVLLAKVENEDVGAKTRTACKSSFGSSSHGNRILSNGGISRPSDGTGEVLQHMNAGHSECSVDKLAKDVETARVTGVSLPGSDQSKCFSVEPCSDSKPNDASSLIDYSLDSTEAKMTNSESNMSAQQIEVPFCDGANSDKAPGSLMCAVMEKCPESSSVASACTDVSLLPVNASAHRGSKDTPSSFGVEKSSIDYITSLLRESAPSSSVEGNEILAAKAETRRDSKLCTPFETPVESPDAEETVDEVQPNPAVAPVGFSEQTSVSDAELEKYLKEAEDNEKLSSLKSRIASVGIKNDGNAVAPLEHDVEGLSSGDEFYSPLMERSDFPHEHIIHDELRPDQTYEEALCNLKKVDEKTINNVEPPSVTENDVCPSLSVVHNKMVVMESQSTMAVCSTNTGTRPKSSADVDAGNGALADGEKFSKESQDVWLDRRILHDAINRERAQRTKSTKIHMVKEQQNLEIKNQLHVSNYKNVAVTDGSGSNEGDGFSPQLEQDCRSPYAHREHVGLATETSTFPNEANEEDSPPPAYDSEQCFAVEDHSGQNVANDSSRRQRPTSLNLSGKLEVAGDETSAIDDPPKAEFAEAEEALLLDESRLPDDGTAAAEKPLPEQFTFNESTAAAASTTAGTDVESQIGKVAPFWIPDADAPACMQCNIKFTVIKRRHHCRACGRVLCGQCCAWKAKLQYMDNKEARVCHQCLQSLHKEYLFEENPDTEELFVHLQDKQAPPVMFAVNKNLYVHVKILTLDCCIKKTCWFFSTEGMGTVGQEELLVLLECLPDEKIVPEDMFSHFNSIYEDASQGNLIMDLGHTIFTQSFLGSREHGGFLYVRPTFQCLNQLPLPPQPYLVGILLQKWETPWAKVFPIRLMLRLGSEFRFYPCPLVSIRFRKPVYGEIGHTIMNLLADFRNYQYKLPVIRGMVIHMEEKRTHINIPRNRYEEAMKALNNSNDHVLALGGNFSLEADSHLVCIQNDDGNYQTQAINIENKPRKVTGASFVVFNGALKSSSGLSAKSSIVEDGLMVQIPPDTMTALRQALREMHDFQVKCGPLTAELPEEEVLVCWVEDDKNINVGVKSPIDGMSMQGIASLHIHGGTDYVDQRLLIRWTEVFFIHTDEGTSGRRSEPINTSRLAEILAQACCMALTMHLKALKEASLIKIGLRVTIDSENVGYEIGAQEMKLPAEYMNDLDSELVPVIHRAASQAEDASVTLELIFHIMEQ